MDNRPLEFSVPQAELITTPSNLLLVFGPSVVNNHTFPSVVREQAFLYANKTTIMHWEHHFPLIS